MYSPQLERNRIICNFNALGFFGKSAFFNVCKNLDVAFSGFELVAFYDGNIVKQKTINRLNEILEVLKNE
tara:strand:- start:1990 stop:2199 length:210 start_codon:yes stop_codon:yes gene_type:complete